MAALGVALAVAAGAALPIGDTIGYQLHSYDDLRELPAILLKGMMSWKIDPQYAPASFCASQPRANHSDTRGCFMLNHDLITTSNWYYDLNDVLTTVTSADLLPYFTRPDVHMQIALCFKGNGALFACDNSTGFNDWVSLIDTFFDRANEVIAQNHLNLEFVLDGAAVPGAGACIAQRWRPWVATYCTGNDPAGAFESNNATLAYDRYQVLNEDVGHWLYAVNNSYGKFTESTHEYQCWEPSDAPTLQQFSDAYIQKGLTHAPSFRFASNTDPALFETYLGTRTGRAWDHMLVDDASAAQPLLAVAPVPTQAFGGSLVSFVAYAASGADQQAGQGYAFHVYPAAHAAPVQLTTGKVPLPTAVTDVDAATLANGTVLLLLSSSATATGSVSVSTSVFSVASKADTTLVAPAAVLNASYAVDGTVASVRTAVATCSAGASDFCSASIMIADQAGVAPGGACILSLAATRSATRMTIAPVCVAGAPAAANASVNVSSVVVKLLPAAAAPGAALAAFTYAADGMVYSGAACVDFVAGTINTASFAACGVSVSDDVGSSSSSVAPPPMYATYTGDQPSLALASGGSTSYVLQAYRSGYCPNNEPQNKNAYVKLCDQVPRDTGGAYLQYSLGTIDAWVQQWRSGQLATPCSTTVLTGMYNMGTRPSPALWGGGAGNVTFAIAQEGLRTGGTDPNDCGIAVPAEGITLSGWQTAMPLPA